MSKWQTSYEWMKQLGIEEEEILDFDGWDRANLIESLNAKLTEEEFVNRLAGCTIKITETAISLFRKYGL